MIQVVIQQRLGEGKLAVGSRLLGVCVCVCVSESASEREDCLAQGVPVEDRSKIETDTGPP
jgi:hypothetical protein